MRLVHLFLGLWLMSLEASLGLLPRVEPEPRRRTIRIDLADEVDPIRPTVH